MKILLMITNNFLKEFKPNENRTLSEEIMWHIGNSGNLLFLNGYIAMLEGQNYEFWDQEQYSNSSEEYYDYINQNYDCAIYPLANNITERKSSLEPVVQRIKKLTIPTFIWGLGITQYGKFDIQKFNTIGNADIISDLVKTVDKYNGKIFVRGYYSGEVLKKYCGIENVDELIIPMGCPSMYQLGCLSVENVIVDKKNFCWGLNGLAKDIKEKRIWHNMNKYKSFYIDQDEFPGVLLDQEPLDMLDMLKKYGIATTQLICEDRIKFFYHLSPWYNFVKENIDFMFGHRIHGNLIALLAGKPCAVWNDFAIDDVRTREIAEFYNIPIIRKAPKDIYDVYKKIDIQPFNQTIKKRYDDYTRILDKLGINKNFNPQKNILETKRYMDIKENHNVRFLKEEYNNCSLMRKKQIIVENTIYEKSQRVLNKLNAFNRKK